MEYSMRDEIAINMDISLIPEVTIYIGDKEVIVKKYGIKYDSEDILSRIDFLVAYHAIFRYKYADAMMLQREIDLNRRIEISKNNK